MRSRHHILCLGLIWTGNFKLARAKIEIEFGDPASALSHMHKALSYTLPLYGGIFHESDLMLSYCEITLRSLIISHDIKEKIHAYTNLHTSTLEKYDLGLNTYDRFFFNDSICHIQDKPKETYQ